MAFEVLSRKMFCVNWNEYQSTFPVRYTEPSGFDDFLVKHVCICDVVLELGANKGREYLRGFTIDSYDPFCEPTGYKRWFTDINKIPTNHYTKVIARNSINYLSESELSLVKSFMKVGAKFFANTFVNEPQDRSRPFANASGELGVEEVTYDKSTKEVTHSLMFLDGRSISHKFWYRSVDELLKLLDMKMCSVDVDKNTAWIGLEK